MPEDLSASSSSASSAAAGQILGKLALDISGLLAQVGQIQQAAAQIKSSLKDSLTADQSGQSSILDTIRQRQAVAQEALQQQTQDEKALADVERQAAEARKQYAADQQQQAEQQLSTLERVRQATSEGIGTTLTTVGARLLPLSIPAALTTGEGVDAASRLEQVQFRFKELLGSQEKAVALMHDLTSEAQRLNQPVVDTVETLSRMIVATNGNVEKIKSLESIIPRLALTNTDATGGLRGAQIAIAEALSGNLSSLQRRFRLVGDQLRTEMQATSGDMVKALDNILSRLGYSEGAVQRWANTFQGALSRFRGITQEALATAFQPLTQAFTPLINAAGDFVRGLSQTAPELLQMGAGVTAVVGAAGPLLISIGQITQGLKTIQALSPGVASGLKSALGVGLAVGGGVGIGLAVSRGLADAGVRSGDLGRVAAGEDPGQILLQRLAQILGTLATLLTTGVLEFARGLADGGAVIATAIEKIRDVLSMFVNALKSGAGQIQEGIGNILVGLADKLSGLFDTSGLRQSGQANIDLGRQNQQSAYDEAQAAREDFMKDTLTQRLADVDTFINNLRTQIVGGIANIVNGVGQPASALGQAADSATGPLQQLIGGLNDIASKFADTFQKINQLRAEWAIADQRTEEDRGIALNRTAEDFALRRLREEEKFQQSLADLDASYQAKNTQAVQQVNQQLIEEEQQYNEQRAKVQADFAVTEQRAVEDHEQKLAEIRRNTRLEVQKAAANLDAAGVFNALENGRNQTEQENSQFAIADRRRREDNQRQLAEMERSFKEQQAKRVQQYVQQQQDEQAAYEQRRAQLIANYADQKAMEDQEYALRLKRQAEDYALQDKRRAEDRQRQIADLFAQAGIAAQFSQLWNQTFTNGLQSFQNWITSLTASIPGSSTTSNLPPAGSPSTPPLYASGSPFVPANQWVSVNDDSRKLMETAMIGDRYFARFSKPAQIFAAGRGLATEGPGSMTWHGDIVLGDIGSRTDGEIKGLFHDAFMEIIRKWQQGVGR